MPWMVKMTLLVAAGILPFQIYCAIRLPKVMPDKFKKIFRLLFYGLLILINGFPALLLLQYGFGIGKPAVPYYLKTVLDFTDMSLIIPYWWGLVFFATLLPYLLVTDIFGSIISRIFKSRRTQIRKSIHFILIMLLIFTPAYVVFKTFMDTWQVRLDAHQFAIEADTKHATSLKMGLISDIQVDRFTQDYKLNQMREIVNQENFDFLFFTGDLVTRGKKFIAQGEAALTALNSSKHKIAVLGDHDYWAGAEEIKQSIQNAGWIFLNNEHRVFAQNGHRVLVTGITEIYSKRIRRGDLERLLRHAPNADIKILISHQPTHKVAEFAQHFGYDYVLGGHTHGGQMVFTPFGIPLTPALWETPYYSGLYKLKDLNIIVTNGIGLTLAPLRFQAPAEVTSITIDPLK